MFVGNNFPKLKKNLIFKFRDIFIKEIQLLLRLFGFHTARLEYELFLAFYFILCNFNLNKYQKYGKCLFLLLGPLNCFKTAASAKFKYLSVHLNITFLRPDISYLFDFKSYFHWDLSCRGHN